MWVVFDERPLRVSCGLHVKCGLTVELKSVCEVVVVVVDAGRRTSSSSSTDT